ncbi:MAG: GGDEF domain-containing protein [Gammaproteobacteria bacterium]|nr:GGDEF domain-containing protein [Gammaproteobacteria bacterium]
MKFRLRRYFFLTSLPVVAIITAISTYSYIYFATGILIEHETTTNLQQTRFLGKLIWPRFEPHIAWSKNQSATSLRDSPVTADIDKIVVDLFRDSNIVKAKLYNSDGLTIYSSQHSQIGISKADNPGFISASNGRVRSKIIWRNEFHSFEKVIMDRDIVSSYLPLHDTRTQKVIAVVELYSDVTDLVTSIKRTRYKVIVGALVCFSLLLGALYVLIARADLLISHQNKKLTNAHEEISRLAYIDAVTQLPNRHRFDLDLEEQINHSRRHDEGFSLLYLDLDGFKLVNDKYGHASGDFMLAEIAQRLKQVLRNTDLTYRIGGDEFALLIPGTNTKEDVTLVAEKLLARIIEPIEFRNHIHSISASIGIAFYPTSALNARSLIDLADNAMYKAKASGKNCYEIAQTD